MKPQDFLIGIRDFFAILVPGAVVLMLMPGTPGLTESASEPVRIVGFAIVAFLIGSVADRLGSLLDYVVDPVIKSDWVRGLTGRTNAREAEAERFKNELVGICAPAIESDEKSPMSTRAFWWDICG